MILATQFTGMLGVLPAVLGATNQKGSIFEFNLFKRVKMPHPSIVAIQRKTLHQNYEMYYLLIFS
jgi:hypothetical protein